MDIQDTQTCSDIYQLRKSFSFDYTMSLIYDCCHGLLENLASHIKAKRVGH